MKKLLVMLLLAMSAVVFTVGCGDDDDRPEHILTEKQLEELLETKTATQIFEENLMDENRQTSDDIFCIDAAGLSFLLKKGLDVNAKTKNEAGFTVLYVAAYRGDLELVKELIGKGADVNVGNKYGWTVLHSAAGSGNLEMVKYLVEEKNLDVNAKDDDGWTVLHSAACHGTLEVVEYLVKKGADVNAKHDLGATPLRVTREPKIRGYLCEVAEWKWRGEQARENRVYEPDTISPGNAPAAPSDRSSQ